LYNRSGVRRTDPLESEIHPILTCKSRNICLTLIPLQRRAFEHATAIVPANLTMLSFLMQSVATRGESMDYETFPRMTSSLLSTQEVHDRRNPRGKEHYDARPSSLKSQELHRSHQCGRTKTINYRRSQTLKLVHTWKFYSSPVSERDGELGSR
jgi:hypothetical protein